MKKIIRQSNRFDLFNAYGQAFGGGFCTCLFVVFLAAWYPSTGFLNFGNRFLFGLFMGGVVFAVGTLNTARQRRFGRPVLELELSDDAASKAVALTFRLPVLKRTTPEYIGLFLVYREQVSFHESDEHSQSYDRLMDTQESACAPLDRHHALEIDCCFQLPNLSSVLRNPYSAIGKRKVSVTSGWLIKVKIGVAGEDYLWYEYDLRSVDLPDPGTLSVEPGAKYFSVILESVSLFNMVLTTGLYNLLVHLRRDQVHDMMHAVPVIVRERLTFEEASEIRDFIESIGAKASVAAEQ